MASVSIFPPYPSFFDVAGKPLENGYIWIGTANLDPQVNPIPVYWDAALTITAAQPIRTIGGYPSRSGTPAQIFVASSTYSMRVQDKNGIQQYYLPEATQEVGFIPDANSLFTQTNVRDALNAISNSSTGSAYVGFLQSGLNARVRTVLAKLRDTISVFDFMTAAQIAAVQANDYTTITGTEITTACQAALTAAAGRTCHFPAGTYRITSTLSYNPAASFGFAGPGIRITGDGMLRTFFDNRVASAPMIDIDAAAHGSPYTASMAAMLERFSIFNVTSPANSTGVRLVNAYQVIMEHLYIKGMTAHGIEMLNGGFVDDGWNMVSLRNMWIDSCGGWGIKADGADSPVGRNEGSYTYLEQVFFQANGTASAASIPPSGGMIWKGQILTMEQCAFANGTQNVGLFIKGGPGLGQTADLRGVTFENCVKRSLYCTGISVFRGRNLQFYNDNDYLGTVQCEFDGSTYTVRQVDIETVTIRATVDNNPITAFKIGGANADLRTCRVRGVQWENFEYPNQTRFDGWQFDQIPISCDVVALNATTLLLRPNQTVPRGNTMPLRLRGGLGGSPSTTGEWVAYQVPGAGLSISNSGLANSTRYYVYLYDNNGAVALELATVVPTFNAATGYSVKTGDATRLYCGSTITDGSAQFVTSGTGWLNPMIVPGSQTGAYTWMWTDSTTRLRVKYSTPPTSDTDGTVVGTQT